MIQEVLRLGAERAFRLDLLDVDGDEVTGSMPTGPWLADRHGTPLAGSLGVLVDDVLGTALIRARAQRRWSVSSEITVDVVRPLAFTGETLHATTIGAPLLDELGSHVAGTVSTAAGEVVAVCTQRGRWVPFDEDAALPTPPAADPVPAGCVEDLLGATPTTVEGGATMRLAVGPRLTNPLGTLHGGLSLCASDLVASATATGWDRPWVTESLRIDYLRPIPGGADVEFTARARHVGRGRAVVEVTGSVAGRVCTLALVAGRPHATGRD